MYYLHHYFNPDFNHLQRAPEEAADGSTYSRYLGYVQNVVAGQVLAELMPSEDAPVKGRDSRFFYTTPHLPIGPNTASHKGNPHKIIATTNGYVFYNKGVICVKKLLNIRGNVGFHTGNIFFVNDLVVHGDVQTDFAVQASNILVKRHIESAKVKAAHDIVCLGGVKGAEMPVQKQHEDSPQETVPSTLLDAGGNIRLPFCERVQLRARGNIIIDGSCLHSTIYVGGNVIIRGRLLGGSIYGNGIVYVEQQMGSGYDTKTSLMMGYDPFEFLLVQKLESQIRYLQGKMLYFEKQTKRNAVMEQEFAPRLRLAQEKLAVIHKKRDALWRRFSLQEKQTEHCQVIVPGSVMPGCEISIGTDYYHTTAPLMNASFQMKNGEVTCTTPAIAVNHEMLNNPVKER